MFFEEILRFFSHFFLDYFCGYCKNEKYLSSKDRFSLKDLRDFWNLFWLVFFFFF